MTRAFRTATIFALLAGGLVLAPGCGSNSNDCNTLPELASAPNSCSFPANSTVTVQVRWCNCNSTITCDVTDEGSGVFQAEPKVSACDATCDTSGASCAKDTVDCVFRTPASGTGFSLVVRGASTDDTVPFTIAGGSATCSL